METRRATRADLEDIAALLEASSLPPLPHDSYPSNVLVVLDCRHPHDAIQFQVDRREVISNGRRAAGTSRETWVASPPD